MPTTRVLRIGDLVVALKEISEATPDGGKLLHASGGSMGHVIDLRQGYFPTIRWESSVCDCIPSEEIEVIRGFDLTFASPVHE